MARLDLKIAIIFLKKEIKTTFVSTKNKTNSSFLKYQISNKALKLKKN